MNTPLQLAAFALADFLSGDPDAPPYRAVAFIIGPRGHRNAGLDPRTAARMHARIRKWARRTSDKLRALKKLDYDPLDVVEFSSFDELIAKRPASGAWQSIFLVTHAGGEESRGTTGSIFFGDREMFITGSGINDLLDEINRKRARVDAFRRGFQLDSQLSIFACGVGASGPDVAIYTRELFGVEGAAHFPLRNVDLDANGVLLINDGKAQGRLRVLTKADMSTILPKEDALPKDAEVPPP
jgi:hypothetical protein